MRRFFKWAGIVFVGAARAVLAELVKEGRKPAQEEIIVFVWAQQDALRGETGTPMVRMFGHTTYDYNYDRLDFEAQR